MGLAASQARFLGLTARKSNVEYQGQQVNQARTALSNEVNRLYEKYNQLDVPVPPSQTDYVKTTYKVDSADEDYEVSKFEKITDTTSPYYGYYNLTLEYEEKIAQVYSNTKGSIIQADGSNGNYSYLHFTIGTNEYKYKDGEENNTITKIDTQAEGFDASKYMGLENIIKYNKEKGLPDQQYYYMYKDEDSGICNYTTGSDLDDTTWTQGEDYKTYSGSYTFQYEGSKSQTKQRNAIGSIDQASSGRLNSINIISCEEDPKLVGNTYSITTTSEEDEKGYEEAMNQYNYDKQVYEQEIEKLNAETEKIQTEDRSLELKLDQLDTEQRALATEMDSVKEVIKSTIESIFKTYDS